MTELLGLPLDKAVEIIRRTGIEPTVILTQSDRHPVLSGILRVIRINKDGSSIVATRIPEMVEADIHGID